MNRTQMLEDLIIKSGYNLKDFSRHAEIPYTTLLSILSRGIGNAGFDNISKICVALNISLEDLDFIEKEKDSDMILLQSMSRKMTSEERKRAIKILKAAFDNIFDEIQ